MSLSNLWLYWDFIADEAPTVAEIYNTSDVNGVEALILLRFMTVELCLILRLRSKLAPQIKTENGFVD